MVAETSETSGGYGLSAADEPQLSSIAATLCFRTFNFQLFNFQLSCGIHHFSERDFDRLRCADAERAVIGGLRDAVFIDY